MNEYGILIGILLFLIVTPVAVFEIGKSLDIAVERPLTLEEYHFYRETVQNLDVPEAEEGGCDNETGFSWLSCVVTSFFPTSQEVAAYSAVAASQAAFPADPTLLLRAATGAEDIPILGKVFEFLYYMTSSYTYTYNALTGVFGIPSWIVWGLLAVMVLIATMIFVEKVVPFT